MRVTIHKAKTNLSKLIEAALAGEDVVISKGDVPVVRLSPILQGGFKFGLLADKDLGAGPDFFEPLGEEDAVAWEGGAPIEK